MADINAFSFTGRLGADGKVNTTPNGKSVLELSVANSVGFGDYKKTNWLKVRQWGDRVNNIVGIFKKGALVGGTGEVSVETYTGKDGETRTNMIVTCMNIQLLQSKKDDGQESSDNKDEGPVF